MHVFLHFCVEVSATSHWGLRARNAARRLGTIAPMDLGFATICTGAGAACQGAPCRARHALSHRMFALVAQRATHTCPYDVSLAHSARLSKRDNFNGSYSTGILCICVQRGAASCRWCGATLLSTFGLSAHLSVGRSIRILGMSGGQLCWGTSRGGRRNGPDVRRRIVQKSAEIDLPELEFGRNSAQPALFDAAGLNCGIRKCGLQFSSKAEPCGTVSGPEVGATPL